MMRIAVTGGSGRVGQAVVDLALAGGHEVVCIDRAPPAGGEGAEFIAADVTDYEALLRAIGGCEALVHLAAIAMPGQLPDHIVHNTNVTGSYNALRAAAEAGIGRVCQASSVNALGAAFSRRPHFDYLPLDEAHPSYAEDPYSLSKWICEQQAAAVARRYEGMTIGSLRLHWIVDERPNPADYPEATAEALARNLWGYTRLDAAARACLAVLGAGYRGHEVFFITAPETMVDEPSLALATRWYPGAELRGGLEGNQALFRTAKAERLLGWRHDG